MSDIANASGLPQLAKAELEEKNKTEDVRRECDERIDSVRRECRAELDDVPRSLRQRRRGIVEEATAQADCDVDQVNATLDGELASVRSLTEELVDELVSTVMASILPDSPECQRQAGGDS